MTRRKFVYSFLGGTASYSCFLEPSWLRVARHEVTLTRIRPTEPIRILHLSDLHRSFFVPLSMIESAVNLGLAQKPDLICVTGDFITHREDVSSGAYARVLSRLPLIAPTFAVLGNHDGGLWAEMEGGYPDHRVVENLLAQSGIELLHNRAIQLQPRGSPLTLVGVGDLWSGELHATRAFADADSRKPVLLLAHNPDSKDALENHQWDLMLSGHTHGGQVILPFQGPAYAPVWDKRYVAGLKPWGSRQIHVTRGVGNLGGVRFGCRPEVSLLVVC
jgi:predicted MPP superfamily phosphohydrolase